MKKYLCFILVLTIILTLSFSLIACDKEETEKEAVPESYLEYKVHEIYGNASIDPQTITTVQQLATITSINYSLDGKGPITITPAKLNGDDYTLVTLSGTQFVEGQATSIKESQLASFGKSNDYIKAVVKLFENGTVPKDKPIIVTGISLGGMIAQQICGEKTITDNFDVRYVITFGSPLTMPLDRGGIKVIRFTDKHDSVPRLGETSLYTLGITMSEINASHRAERIYREGKYNDIVETHALSYIDDECWNDVDFLGEPAGTNSLELLDSLTFYDAPTIVLE